MSDLKQNLNFRDFVLLFSLPPKDPIIWSMKTDACIFTMIRQCFAGAKPTSLGMISACWKGEQFMTSPKESCASILHFFLLTVTHAPAWKLARVLLAEHRSGSSLCPNTASVQLFLLILQEDGGEEKRLLEWPGGRSSRLTYEQLSFIREVHVGL